MAAACLSFKEYHKLLEFLPAGTLKKKFEVFGHFYSVDLVSGEQINCRSVLEIVTTKDKPSDINLLLERAADAVFIMMNPGSSLPLEEVNNIIPEKQVGGLCASLVLTKPDTTQYQVMRVMHYCGWSHVRVLNLSDLRNPKGGEFVKQYCDIENRTGFTAHSLFSDQRRDELVSNLNRKAKSPVVCAWGVSPDLDPLIERCTSKISGVQDCLGLLKPQTKNRYFHPLPTLQKSKIKWVDNMVSLINS
ncbi:MAG: DUF1643 domain-containing protein [Desulfobacteraceae bacterium]|nr:DUF1643 domain-containing protein [Desulfobacteraceae bacterium]